MRLLSDHNVPVKLLGLPRVFWLLILLIVFFTISMKMLPKRNPFVNPKIVAKPYIWPTGCDQIEYKEQQVISESCLESRYYIGDGEKWGWPRGSKRSNYYRVGDHAFDLGCNTFTGTCYVHRIVKNIFVVSK